jgi:hypothetical protein
MSSPSAMAFGQSESDSPPHVPDALEGEWRFAGGETERKRWSRAIERVLDGMSLLARPFARPRIKEGNRIPKNIEIGEEDGRVTVQMNGMRYQSIPGGGWVHARGSDGSKLRLLHRVRGKTLVQIFDADKGKRVNLFVPVSDDRMELRVKVTSPHFESPLRYKLSYARK